MATKSNEFPEGAALLGMLFENTDGQLGTLFDLRNIPPKALEIEQKYEHIGSDLVDRRQSELVEKVGPAARKLGYKTERFTTYSGVDQYYSIRNKRGDSAIFRHRFSANVPAELTAKIQVSQGKNLIRGEFDIPVPNAEMQNVRAFMAVVCMLTHSAKHFCIYQSGMFWTLTKPDGQKCEIVVYKAGELHKQTPRLFVEIEPKNFENPEEALITIRKLEKALRLQRMRCNKSIAELFEPQ